MTVFHVGNCFTTVDNPAPITAAIAKYLVIKKDGFVQSIDHDEYAATGKTILKTKYVPETVNLYNHIRCQFPTGRLGYITDWCFDNKVPIQVIDERIKPQPHLLVEYVGPPSDGSNGKPPRIYQTLAAGMVQSKGGRGILHHATASGKTTTAARMIAEFKVNTLYIVPSLELLSQTVESLERNLKTPDGIGIIGDSEWKPKSITVATAASLWSRFETPACTDLLKSIEFVIFDECHHSQLKQGNKYEKNKHGEVQQFNSWYIIAINTPAYYRVGLTGTPGKDIEKKRSLLECAIGRVVHRVSARELIDLGVISDVEIHMHTIKHSKKFLDFPTARKECILLNEPFNEYIVQIAMAELKQGRSVLLLTGSKEHQGPLLQKIFLRYGMEVPFVSGDSKKKDRKDAREEFRAGVRRILIGTIYKEGVDFPSLDSGILCDGGMDEKKTIQFLGRVLRTAEGKTMARLHDFNVKDGKHLSKHSAARISTYLDEELDKIITHKGINI